MTPTDDETTQIPRFIRDDPAVEDAFGAHSRISDALAATILSDEPPRTVGLIGPWGSGKSTVVSMLEKRLGRAASATDFPRVFVFDAWLRQGEPPRRSFLEELVAFAAASKLCDVDVLGDALDRLSGRVIVTRTTERPMYSKDAWAIVVAVGAGSLLGAEAAALKSVPLIGTLVDLVRNVSPWLPRFVPTLIPVATIVAVMLRRAVHRLRHSKGVKGPDVGEDVLTLLLNRQAQSKETRVVGTPTVTALEFQAVYWTLLSAIEGNAGRLVIVIDNLDRLPPTEARELWSMLRTFLVGKPPGGANAIRPPVVVVPVAIEAVDVIYPAQHSGANADGFMQKTFDAVFHLPQPVFTRWQHYFCRQVERSLGRPLAEDEDHVLTRLVDEHFARQGVAVTPRHLNTLVNLVASYALQANEDHIALSSVLYYCLNKAEIDKNIILAVGSRPFVQAVLSRTWTEDIAALHFGVKRVEATRALLEAPLVDAIKAGRKKSFNRLLGVPGAAQILQRILTHMGQQNLLGPEALAIMGLLAGAEGLSDTEKRYAWTQVLRALEVETGWTVGRRELRIAEHFIQEAPSSLRAETVTAIEVRLAAATLQGPPFPIEALAKFWAWVDDLTAHAPRLLSTFRIPGDARTFIQVAVALLRTHRVIDGMKPMAPAAEVVELLRNDLQGETDGDECRDRLLAVVPLALNVDWVSYVHAASFVVFENAKRAVSDTVWRPTASLGVAILGLALLRHEEPAADVTLDDLANEGVFAQLLATALACHDMDIAGAVTGLMMCMDVQPSLPLARLPLHDADDMSWAEFDGSLLSIIEHASIPGSLNDIYPWPVPPDELDLLAHLKALGVVVPEGGNLP